MLWVASWGHQKNTSRLISPTPFLFSPQSQHPATTPSHTNHSPPTIQLGKLLFAALRRFLFFFSFFCLFVHVDVVAFIACPSYSRRFHFRAFTCEVSVMYTVSWIWKALLFVLRGEVFVMVSGQGWGGCAHSSWGSKSEKEERAWSRGHCCCCARSCSVV